MRADGYTLEELRRDESYQLMEQLETLQHVVERDDLDPEERAWAAFALEGVHQRYWATPSQRQYRDSMMRRYSWDPSVPGTMPSYLALVEIPGYDD